MNVRNHIFGGKFPSSLNAIHFFFQLQSHLEETEWAFIGMSGLATFASLLIAWLGMRRCGFFSGPAHSPRILTTCENFPRSDRLAKIRKIGLSSTANGQRKPKRRPWLPLPLRRRGPDDWA